jgi:glutathione synthase/RimK-type ligase-like ATP-grasp enzyme
MRTLLVVDGDRESELLGDRQNASFEAYLRGGNGLRDAGLRVVNLCDTEHYLSRGYYCSLLAEARRQKVIPDVATINDLRDLGEEEAATVTAALTRDLAKVGDAELGRAHHVYFGWTAAPEMQPLAADLFRRYPAPILSFSIETTHSAPLVRLCRVAFSSLDEEERALCLEQLDRFMQASWQSSRKQRSARWDMAILVNPEESHPPSDVRALKRFLRAASRQGIRAELLTAQELTNLSFYDALFIRETTAIDHHTYRLARRAEELGLVVIDDSRSILRCCNKVYLHDAFDSENVPTLRTRLVSHLTDDVLEDLEQEFGYPMVLKMPESSFSLGVFRVESRDALVSRLTDMLTHTALALVQEYFYTQFDWRIGVLERRALYACRYAMARHHWQIYNHTRKRGSAGDSVSLPTFEVPRPVLDAAVRACRVAGDGLYGVDIKQDGGRIAVIEVNDNPSIDAGVEDEYLGRELYDQVMRVFAHRLERRGR